MWSAQSTNLQGLFTPDFCEQAGGLPLYLTPRVCKPASCLGTPTWHHLSSHVGQWPLTCHVVDCVLCTDADSLMRCSEAGFGGTALRVCSTSGPDVPISGGVLPPGLPWSVNWLGFLQPAV